MDSSSRGRTKKILSFRNFYGDLVWIEGEFKSHGRVLFKNQPDFVLTQSFLSEALGSPGEQDFYHKDLAKQMQNYGQAVHKTIRLT
jgi:hypothetical protein